MAERTESKAVELSCDLYLRLLNFYPRAHRQEYGAPMLQLFRDQCRDAWTARRCTRPPARHGSLKSIPS